MGETDWVLGLLMQKKPTIHDRGRGPEIEGTRITVYDVMDYYLDGWPASRIAIRLSQGTPEIEAAIEYIEAHRTEVEADYRKIVARAEQGNSPEVQAIVDANRAHVEARKSEIRQRAKHARGVNPNGSQT